MSPGVVSLACPSLGLYTASLLGRDMKAISKNASTLKALIYCAFFHEK